MKAVLLCTLMAAALFLSCKNDPKQQSVEWTVGQSAASVNKTFKLGDAGALSLTLDNSSLCASSGIRILIEANNQQVYQEMAIQFPFVKSWTLDPRADISITTEVAEFNPDIQCTQLGDVKVTAKY
jgi:hypothetical protein